MPKIKKQSENLLEHSNSASDNKSKRKYGFPYRKGLNFCCFQKSVQSFTSQPAEKPTFAEDTECSIKLFPHLIHVRDLTKDFIDRASGVIQIPKDQSINELMKKDRIKVRGLDTLSSQSLLGSEEFCEPRRWPFIPTICVSKIEQAKINNEVLLMDEHKYKKTKKMLENRCVNTKEIRSAITHPDVREVHEALTELLETPIWKLLLKIKQNMDIADASNQLEMLSMELDILLNTVKHPGCSDTVKTTTEENEVCSIIPEELKNYLFRKREVSGFGLWNTEEFRVFVNQETKGRHIRENLLKVFASFFKIKRLNVMNCEPSFHPNFQPGDKIFPTNSALAKTEERGSLARDEKGYGTLGGFVTDKNSNIYALTCGHVCKKDHYVFAAYGDSEREKIGECVFSNYLEAKHIPILPDVALVKIDDEVKDRCNRTMLSDIFHLSKFKIFSDNLENLVNRAFVYKVGAQTRLTKGYILSPALYITGRDDTFLVSGFGDVHFAEPGDSGSVVFMNENSSALDTINVIGMFFGSCTLNVEDCKEKSACLRMDTAFEFLNQNGWDIWFENQI